MSAEMRFQQEQNVSAALVVKIIFKSKQVELQHEQEVKAQRDNVHLKLAQKYKLLHHKHQFVHFSGKCLS